MKVYISKELIKESEEVAAAIKELKSSLAAQKIARRDLTAARDYYDRSAYLKARIQELKATLEDFYPNFDPDAPDRKQDGKWHHARQHLWGDIVPMESELSRLENSEPPDLERLMEQSAALDRKIASLQEKISGYVGIEIAPIPDPDAEEVLEIERREVARIRGVLELEGTRAPGSPGGFVRVRR